MEGDRWCLLQKTISLAQTDQHGRLQSTTKRDRLLANIRRVLRECQRNGFRLDGAVEDLGLIREPVVGELV